MVYLGEYIEDSDVWIDVAPAVKAFVTAARSVFDTIQYGHGKPKKFLTIRCRAASMISFNANSTVLEQQLTFRIVFK